MGMDVGTAPAGGELGAADHRDRFWSLYIGLGFAVLALESIAALCYFSLLPTVRHRTTLVVVSAVVLGIAIGFLPVVRCIARQRWRARFVFVMVLLIDVTVTACCALNGGIDSALAYLLVLPVSFSAIALPPPFVVACGSLSLVDLICLWLTDTSIMTSDARLFIEFALLLGVLVLSTVSSAGTNRLHREEERIRMELARQAKIDAVTGCLNSRGFHARLQEEVDRAVRYGGALSLLIVDVDLFKSFNDTYGHSSGDAVLAAIGEGLRSASRQSDVVARIGGDEFAVIVPSTPLERAEEAAQRLRLELRHRPGVGVSVSIGVAALSSSEPTAERLFRDADAALYQAKADGRGRVAIASGTRPRCGPHHAPREEDRPGEEWVPQEARGLAPTTGGEPMTQ